MQKFDYGRNALSYLVQTYNIKELHIPYYLCDVIRHTLFEVGCKPLFYHVDDNFMPTGVFKKEEFILYPNYFGVCSKNVEKLINLYPRLIVDNAHSFYAQPSGFACFNCSRKFLTQNKGAFLWINGGVNPYKPDLTRRIKFDSFHEIYASSNNLFLDLNEDDVPFCYPFLASSIDEADALVAELNKQGLVIYRYWKNLPESFNEYKFYSRLVPIPLK